MYQILDSGQAEHWMLWFAGLIMGAFFTGRLEFQSKIAWLCLGAVGVVLTLYFGDWR